MTPKVKLKSRPCSPNVSFGFFSKRVEPRIFSSSTSINTSVSSTTTDYFVLAEDEGGYESNASTIVANCGRTWDSTDSQSSPKPFRDDHRRKLKKVRVSVPVIDEKSKEKSRKDIRDYCEKQIYQKNKSMKQYKEISSSAKNRKKVRNKTIKRKWFSDSSTTNVPTQESHCDFRSLRKKSHKQRFNKKSTRNSKDSSYSFDSLDLIRREHADGKWTNNTPRTREVKFSSTTGFNDKFENFNPAVSARRKTERKYTLGKYKLKCLHNLVKKEILGEKTKFLRTPIDTDLFTSTQSIGLDESFRFKSGNGDGIDTQEQKQSATREFQLGENSNHPKSTKNIFMNPYFDDKDSQTDGQDPVATDRERKEITDEKADQQKLRNRRLGNTETSNMVSHSKSPIPNVRNERKAQPNLTNRNTECYQSSGKYINKDLSKKEAKPSPGMREPGHIQDEDRYFRGKKCKNKTRKQRGSTDQLARKEEKLTGCDGHLGHKKGTEVSDNELGREAIQDSFSWEYVAMEQTSTNRTVCNTLHIKGRYVELNNCSPELNKPKKSLTREENPNFGKPITETTEKKCKQLEDNKETRVPIHRALLMMKINELLSDSKKEDEIKTRHENVTRNAQNISKKHENVEKTRKNKLKSSNLLKELNVDNQIQVDRSELTKETYKRSNLEKDLRVNLQNPNEVNISSLIKDGNVENQNEADGDKKSDNKGSEEDIFKSHCDVYYVNKARNFVRKRLSVDNRLRDSLNPMDDRFNEMNCETIYKARWFEIHATGVDIK